MIIFWNNHPKTHDHKIPLGNDLIILREEDKICVTEDWIEMPNLSSVGSNMCCSIIYQFLTFYINFQWQVIELFSCQV